MTIQTFRVRLAVALGLPFLPTRPPRALELAAIRAELVRPIVMPAERDGFDATLGVVSFEVAARVRQRVLAQVVVPCIEALLG